MDVIITGIINLLMSLCQRRDDDMSCNYEKRGGEALITTETDFSDRSSSISLDADDLNIILIAFNRPQMENTNPETSGP